MTLDKELMFSTDQALATAASTNVLDLKDCGDDLGRNLNVFAKIEVGAVDGGDSLQAKMQTSPNGSDWEDLVIYPDVALADLNADGWLVKPQPLPAGLQRYVRLSYTATGSFGGSGRIVAGLTASLDVSL